MHMPVKASVISCRASTPLASAGYANKRCAPSISRAAIMTSLAMAGTAGTRLHHSRVRYALLSLSKVASNATQVDRLLACHRKDACSSVNHFFQRCTEPSRRMTNSLLALNTCVFAAQSVSGGAVTRWGIKVNSSNTSTANSYTPYLAMPIMPACLLSSVVSILIKAYVFTEQCCHSSRSMVAAGYTSLHAPKFHASCCQQHGPQQLGS